MSIKLRGKFLIPTIILVMLGIGALSVIAYRTASGILEKAVTHQVDQTADMLKVQVELWVQDMVLGLQTHSTRESLNDCASGKSRDEKQLKGATEALKEIHKNYPAFQRAMLTGLDGKVIAASTPESVGNDYSAREYFKQATATKKAAVSDVILSKSDGKTVFVCCVPLIRNGVMAGTLVASVSTDYFREKFIVPLRIGMEGYAFVVDRDGRMVAHPKKEMVLTATIANDEWGKEILDRKSGLIHFMQGGIEKLVAFRQDEFCGWIVGVSANETDILADTVEIRNMILMGGAAVTILLCLGLAWLITRLVVTPLALIMDFMQRASVGDTRSDVKVAALFERMLSVGDEMGHSARAAAALRGYLDTKVREAQAIADGDFTAHIEVASSEDRLGNAFNQMNQRLNRALSQVVDLAHRVGQGTHQIADASHSLSSGATESAASLEEINASILEIGAQTRTNAENAGQASQLSIVSKESAEKGNSDVLEMVGAMTGMQESGRQIAKIVKMIDDIAFQTNLLSLNAAVEAARAGRHGKGFAVVAEEVRSLAGRSATAARETAELVEGTVRNLEKGAGIARSTEESLKAVVANVVKVSDLLGEIATASNEQAQGITQIGVGLGQIDKVTQQNTANAEETSAAAQELSAQARQLNQLMGQFILDGEIAVEVSPVALPATDARPARFLTGGA